MNNFILIRHEKENYSGSKNNLLKDSHIFGYWNSVDAIYGNKYLLEQIKSISSLDLKNLLKQIDFSKLPQISNDISDNASIIYGPSLYWYAFFTLRIFIQYNF